VIGGKTAVYGVVGWPIGHSLSPLMQNAACAAAGIDAVYVALPVAPEAVIDALRGAHALGLRGLNVTVPHKLAAVEACVRLDGAAMACGAVNTLVRGEAGWSGHNTDAPALRTLLTSAEIGPGARVLVLGAGGAARAALWAASALGAEVIVAARREDAARALRDEVGGRVYAIAWGDVAEEGRTAECVVNATSAGLGGKGDLPAIPFHPGQVACDFVYGDTAFARAARAAGARVVTGEEILVRQGELAFALWHGREAPPRAMADALAAASGARTS
jgi:shikimate dehydrogenase